MEVVEVGEEIEGMEVVRGWWRGVVVVEGLEGVKVEVEVW